MNEIDEMTASRIAALEFALRYYQHHSPTAAPGDEAVIATAEKFAKFLELNEEIAD